MANWHTNNLTGSDTTGDGSPGNPYKTITKAVSVAATEDTIKVAGSEISDVAGITLTSTGTNVFTTSADPTGIISANDIISITHPQLGADKFFYRVVSITTTNITLNETFDFGTGLAIRKFTTPSYSSSISNVTFESPTFTGKRLDITGGWNSDFSAQTGWTIASFNTAGATTTSCVFMSMTSIVLNSYFEKFAFFNLANGFTGNTSQTNFGDLIATRVTNLLGGTPKTIPGNIVNWYIISSTIQSGATSLITNGKYALQLENVYTINRNTGVSPIVFGSIPLSIVNCYQINQVLNTIPTQSLGLSRRGGLITNLNMYANGTLGQNQLCLVGLESAYALEVNNVAVFGSNSDYCGFSSGFTIGYQIYFNTPSINMSNFKWGFSSDNSPMPMSSPTAWIKDIEGNKVVDSTTLWYADSSTFVTGNNSLKLKQNALTGNAYPVFANINIGNAITEIIITIKIKSANVGGPSFNPEVILRNPAFSLVGGTNTFTLIDVTDTFQDKIITITDAATINKYKNNIAQISIRNNPSFFKSPFIWIDSVTVEVS